MTAQSIEEAFNFGLAEALCQTNRRWYSGNRAPSAEQTRTIAESDAKHPDVLLLDEQSPPIVVECSYDASDAHNDACARLGLHTQVGYQEIRTACAVHIPARYRSFTPNEVTAELLSGEELSYALHQKVVPEDGGAAPSLCWPSDGFAAGTVWHLASFLSAAALPKEYVEAVADDVAELVDYAAQGLELELTSAQQRKIADLVYQRTPLKGLRTTMVLWLNALLTQQRLSMQGATDAPSLDFSAEQKPVPSDVAAVWRTLLDENWRSIFEPAVRVLERASSLHPAGTSHSLALLVQAAEKIEVARLGLHINVGAELFPKLSDDRKEAAKFYTQPPTAELLAGLAIGSTDLPLAEWAHEDLIQRSMFGRLGLWHGNAAESGLQASFGSAPKSRRNGASTPFGDGIWTDRHGCLPDSYALDEFVARGDWVRSSLRRYESRLGRCRRF